MRLDIPECHRCFLCIPLRYGIIVFGYLNFLFGLLALSLETTWMVERANGTVHLGSDTIATYKGVSFFTQTWLLLMLYAAEVAFNIVLLIGAHTRRIKLIRIYYYYGVTTLLAAFITYIVVALHNLHTFLEPIELSITFLGLASQAYLLLLIRTEMMKRRYEEGATHHEYVNNLNSHYPPNWREPDVL